MEKVKEIINHPLSKAVLAGIVGATLLVESHPMYAGVAFVVFPVSFRPDDQLTVSSSVNAKNENKSESSTFFFNISMIQFTFDCLF